MSTDVTLTVLIPTPGQGRPLARALQSVANQPLHPGDECIVIGDTTDGELPEVEEIVRSFGPQFRYISHPGTVHQIVDLGGYSKDCHSYGHEQLTEGMRHAKGAWLCFSDDDDIFLDGAFTAIRTAAAALPEPRPLLFKFIPWFRQLLWVEQVIEEHRIGGHQLVAPNIPARLGRFSERYQGDYDFVRSTIDLWPNKDADVVWREEVIVLARPDQ